MKKISMLTLSAVLVVSMLCHADTIHVPGEQPSIQAGIDAAVNGDTVLVAPGTFVENIDFIGKAITVKSSEGPDVTVIDGNRNGSVVIFKNQEGSDTFLRGFTLTNGTGREHFSPPYYSYQGGAIYCQRASPSIIENVISGNKATTGGGIMCSGFTSPLIEGNIITDNKTTGIGGRGGGIFIGGDAYGLIKNNIISKNSSDNGGGIYCWWDAETEITGNIISENSAIGTCWAGGGGIWCGDQSECIISNNIISHNLSNEKGGGVVICNRSELRNSLLIENSAPQGGGLYIPEDKPIISNCTFIANTASIEGGGILCLRGEYSGASIHPKIYNTILWDNDAPTGPQIALREDDPSFTTELTIASSDVQGGQADVYVEAGCQLNWGPGMIDADPRFAAGPDGSYYLRHIAAGQKDDSPCIDAGSDLASSLGMDTLWTRTDEVADTGVVDMGFHYGAFSSSWTAPLYPDAYTIPETTGGTVNLYLDAGVDKAYRNYILLGGASGTKPGYVLPGGQAILPLNFDIYTINTVIPLINTYIFSNFMGALDANGRATAQLNLPPVIGYAGVKTYYAYCLGWQWEFASNPVEVEIVP